MEVKAKAKYIRMSPRKVRLVVDVIRGMTASRSLDQLAFINKKAVRPVRKLVESAIANAENNFELEKDNLYIKEMRVDDGPTLHRWQPRARGRATPIRKRTSHISLVLSELVDSGEKEGKKQKLETPLKLGAKEDKGEKGEKGGKEQKQAAEKQEKTAEQAEAKQPQAKEKKDARRQEEKSGQSGEKVANKFFRRKSG